MPAKQSKTQAKTQPKQRSITDRWNDDTEIWKKNEPKQRSITDRWNDDTEIWKKSPTKITQTK